VRPIVRRALDTTFSVAADHPDLERAARAIVGCCPESQGALEVVWELDAAHLRAFRDGELLMEGLSSIGEIAAVFERDLYDVVVARAETSFMLHGAALANEESAVLLFGPSGAGKTTMSRALVARGARYITDEFAAVDPEGRVRGLPRALGLLPAAPPLDPATQTLQGTADAYDFVGRNGELVHNDFFALAPEHLRHVPIAVGAVVQLQHDPNGTPGITDLRAADILPAMWDERHRGGEGELEIAIALLKRVPAFRLVTSSVERACTDLASVWPIQSPRRSAPR